MKLINILLCSFLFSIAVLKVNHGFAETKNNSIRDSVPDLKNSVYTDPLLPLFNSFALLYEYRKTNGYSFILGGWYGKSTSTYPKLIEYPGYSVNFSAIIAFRKYFWRNLHFEYQFYPGFTRFFEENEEKFYNSFSLFNEFRIGYKFEYRLFKIPLITNVQWPVGFTVFESNQPKSFKEVKKQDPVFYIFYPNIYLGFRF